MIHAKLPQTECRRAARDFERKHFAFRVCRPVAEQPGDGFVGARTAGFQSAFARSDANDDHKPGGHVSFFPARQITSVIRGRSRSLGLYGKLAPLCMESM